MANRRVVITGLGIVAPNGIGKDEFWEATKQGKSGIDFIKSFDASSFPCRIAGEIKNLDFSKFLDIKKTKLDRMARFTQIGIIASRMAFNDAKLAGITPERIGVMMGIAIGGFDYAKKQHERYIKQGDLTRVSSYTQAAVFTSACPSQVCTALNLKGPAATISTGSSAATMAIICAADQIQNGRADVMLAGGSEAPVNEWILGPYCVAHTVTFKNDKPAEASSPFDLHRDGFVLSEGAAVLILEELSSAQRRGAHIYAEIVGSGMASEAYHEVQPRPDGSDIARAINLALQSAGISAEQIDFVSAHGTSTKLNDMAESQALHEVFGKNISNVSVSALKSMIGHTQGAAGALEAVATVLAIENKVIFPTINYKTPDPKCQINLVASKYKEKDIAYALLNSLGFGGYNAAIVAKRFASDR